MKLKLQLIFSTLILVCSSVLFCACDRDNWYADDNVLTDTSHGSLTNHYIVATGDVKNVTANSATILISANYNYKESLKITPYVIYSDNPEKNYWDNVQLNENSNNATVVKVNNFTSSACEVTLTNLKPSTTYYYRAYATAQEPGHSYEEDNYGEIKSFTTPFDYSIYEAVDLGLSVKWANMNIGASHPEDDGDRFYWGGTVASKNSYNAEWHDFSLSTLKSQGYVDSNNNLRSSYDAATQIWGNKWRMPTVDEVRELVDKCSWKETRKNGNYVYLVTGPNNKFIYLPKLEEYWTATSYSGSDSFFAYKSYYLDYPYYSLWLDRKTIKCIRPVQK